MQSLGELRERHRGPVIDPTDRGFDEARATFNGMIERRPELIVRPLDVADVVTAVRFAREADLPVAVRGGGHGVAGHCVGDGSLVVDLRLMREVVVDPEVADRDLRRRRALGGSRHAESTARARDPGRDVRRHRSRRFDVGRRYRAPDALVSGLTLDNLLRATVVTADGSVLSASESENAELFWALRGGGGNFGVVVDFTFQLHPVGLLLGGHARLSARGRADRASRRGGT